MKRLSFAIGSPPPHPKRGKRQKPPYGGPRYQLPPYKQWRILPSSRCDGLFFWIDTLSGTSFFQKRTALLKQREQIEESVCWPFYVEAHQQTVNDLLQKTTRILELLHENQRIRWILKRFLTSYRLRRFPVLNDVDPITLEAVEEPIQIPSFSQRKIYVFEAEPFARLVHKKLLAHDGQIPLPQFPKNPLTNEPFSFAQQISLLHQCRILGYSSWCLEAYVTSRYKLDEFLTFFKTPLLVSAIRTTLATLKTWEAIDILLDFIKSQHILHTAQYYPTLYNWAIHHASTSDRIERWRKQCLKWYEYEILIQDPDSKEAAFRSIERITLGLCSTPTDLQDLRFESRSTLDGRRGITRVPGSR